MLKKLNEFNKVFTKILIVINILLIITNFIGLYIADTHDLKITFLKYLFFDFICLVVLMLAVETKPNKKE
jgi:hypothetical protein